MSTKPKNQGSEDPQNLPGSSRSSPQKAGVTAGTHIENTAQGIENKKIEKEPKDLGTKIAEQQEEHETRENERKQKQEAQEKKRRRIQATKAQWKKLQDFESIFQPNLWPRFLLLNTEEENLNAFTVEDKLLATFPSEGMSFRKTKGKHNEFVIQTTSKAQSEAYLNIKDINGTPVTVIAHQDMNSICGTVILFPEEDADEEMLLRILKNRNKRAQETKIIELPGKRAKILKIKFAGDDLPLKINLGGRRRDVRPYLPKPAQCHKCSKYGHYQKFCQTREIACYYCGSTEHESKWKCGNKESCINCKAEHHSRSVKCNHYQYYSQLKLLQIRSGMSMKDAKSFLKDSGMEEPKSEATFSASVKNTQNAEATRTQEKKNENQKEPEQENEELEATQTFSEIAIPTNNPYTMMREMNLDTGMEMSSEETEKEIVEEWGDDKEGFWPKESTSKSPRKPEESQRRTRRMREDSPLEKESGEESPHTPPLGAKKKTKKSDPKYTSLENHEVYNSSEEEEVSKVTTFAIPTVIGCHTSPPKQANLKGKERSEVVEHPLKISGPSDPRLRNDLEGVKCEMKKFQEELNKVNKEKMTAEHPLNCGCQDCFWKEIRKKGRITSQQATEIVTDFMANRKLTKKMNEESHEENCFCVTHLKERIKEREKIISTIINESKEKNEQQSKDKMKS